LLLEEPQHDDALRDQPIAISAGPEREIYRSVNGASRICPLRLRRIRSSRS
jgi:hypothetical protein